MTKCAGLKKLAADLQDFHDFLLVDLSLSEATVHVHVREIKRFFHYITQQQFTISKRSIRQFLLPYRGSAKRKKLAALKRYFRDYREYPQLVKPFKFPSIPFRPKWIANKETLQKFYHHLSCDEARLIFLFYATSGLRRNEALDLQITDIDLNQHMVIPHHRSSNTKHTYLTFYNDECQHYLEQYIDQRENDDQKLFQFAGRTVNRWFEQAKQSSRIALSPQRLREFFCSEMLRLGVQECYVDSFCGRVPRSILARHYTDYSPERLKRIYDKAGLTVLS
jgi:site-specific recombinase XerD